MRNGETPSKKNTINKNTMITSAVATFHKLTLKKKIEIIKDFSNLNNEDLKLIKKYQELPDFLDTENNIGPFKIATNFLINSKDYFVPMEIEEPSVVAAASNGAKLIREGDGFFGKYLSNEMIGQIQILDVKGFQAAKNNIERNKDKILKLANETQPQLLKLGGGAKDFEVKKIKNYLVFYLIVNPKDALGANMINTMLEKISPLLAEFSGGKIGGVIISNFGERRMVFVEGKIPIEKLEKREFNGKESAERILNFMDLAKKDIFRAVTHNKGVMNGIDAVLIASGNDFRAAESAVHSFAAKSGRYSPLTDWKIEKGFLKGEIKIPLPVATVGGATNTKKAQLAKKILRVKNAAEFGVVCAAVGLANNLAAIFAITTEGIQKGHMKLHQEFLKKRNNL